MYEIKATGRFKKDIKLLQKRGYNIALLQQVIEILARGESLPKKYADHGLNGEWSEFRECHIQPDWLLIYRIDEDILILTPDQNRHTQRSFLSILHGRISRMTGYEDVHVTFRDFLFSRMIEHTSFLVREIMVVTTV